MFKLRFWKDAAERATKTAAQSVLVGLTLGEGFNAFDLDVRLALGFAAGGFIFSVLTSIASAPFGLNGSASLVD